MQVLFIHRSVGRNLLADGQVRQLLSKQAPTVEFSDYNQNTETLTNATGAQTKPGFTFPGSDTKPASYAAIFCNNPDEQDAQIRDFALSFDTIVIKSCYPNNNIKSDSELETIKASYQSIMNFFSKQKGKQLLILTSPPLAPFMTTPSRAKRARTLADWLATSSHSKNVHIFNLYNQLADLKHGWLKRTYRRLLPFDSHPNPYASQKVAPLFVAALTRLT